LAGVVSPITYTFDVPLMVARGYASLSFLHSAAEYISTLAVPAYIYHLGDFDPSGVDAGRKIEETLRELAPDAEIVFERLAVTPEQISTWNLPTRPTKATDTRAKGFGHISVELDAIEPDRLRRLVQEAIEQHLPADQFAVLKAAEQSERELLTRLVNGGGVVTALARAHTWGAANSIEVFQARCTARARLVVDCDFDLITAVDGLQEAAVSTGLVARIGQDAVQAMMSAAFAKVPRPGDLGDAFAQLADCIETMPKPRRAAPKATIDCAEYLLTYGDKDRLRAWLAKHTAAERAAIYRHFANRGTSHDRSSHPARCIAHVS
jgi:hypothetical protein